MTTTTPDMLLVLPDVSVTAGPQWATLLNAAFTAVDAHDHSPGKGVKVTPAGLNISSDLSFVQNNATDLRSLRLYPNSVFTPGVNDKTCVYSLNGNLYYIDNTGVSIRITNNGTVDVNGAIQTLTIKDTGFFIQYFGDTTRQFRFDASAIPASTARVISMPDSGGNDTLVTLAATQTILNKTLTAPSLSAPSVTNYANLANATAPATPSSGTSNIYVSNVDGQLHLVSSTGVDTAIGASSSSGKNYLQTYYGFALNPATNAATNLTTTGNRSVSQSFFGTSSAVASTLITYNTSSPLRAPGDLQFTIPAASSGVFIESPLFTLDSIDANAGVQFISFEMNAATSGAAAGDVLLSVTRYDSSGTYVESIQPSITQLPSGYFKFKAAFSPASTASAKYALRFTANTASARAIDIQNIIVGPQYATTSDAISAWQPYTPTFGAGWGTVTGVKFFYRRIGETMQIRGQFQAGIVAASSTAVSLPNAFTIDTAKINTTTKQSFGQWIDLNGGGDIATTANLGVLAYNGSDNSNMYFARAAASGGYVIALGTNLNDNRVYDTFNITVPISQWTSTITLAGNANIEFASNTSSSDADDLTSFANGAVGSVGIVGTTTLTDTRLKRVRFQTSVQPTDRLVLEYDVAGTGVWVPAIGANLSAGGYIFQNPLTDFNGTNNNIYGMGVRRVAGTKTDVDVIFGRYQSIATNTGTAVQWGSAGIATGTKWRLAKYSAVGLAELAPATAISQGSISRENVWTPYTPTLSAGFGTVTGLSARYKVLGDSLFVRVYFVTGSIAAATAEIGLPAGFNISATKLPLNNSTGSAGSMVGNYAGARADNYGYVVTAPATSTTSVYLGASPGSTANALNILNANVILNSAIGVAIDFEVPLV